MEADYLNAFQGDACPTTPFLTYWYVDEASGQQGEGKALQCRAYTRGEIWHMAQQTAEELRRLGVGRGDRVTHFMSANRLEDVVLRLAAVTVGCTPVTVNWQADNLERIAYKISATKCRVVAVDQGVTDTPAPGSGLPPLKDVIALAEKELGAPITVFRPHELLAPLVNKTQKPRRSLHVLASGELLLSSPKASKAKPSMSLDQAGAPELSLEEQDADTGRREAGDERMIIFTSGTTGNPKGVLLTYGNYRTNRQTFEQFLQVDASTELCLFCVNPMHHTNSTAIVDWALRRDGKNTQLHLVEKYTTPYWEALASAAEECAYRAELQQQEEVRNYRVIAPMVSRHIDFLDSLLSGDGKKINADKIKHALAPKEVVFLIGSAPVGPTTVERLQKHLDGKLPTVRFGSTETCLQVMGTPLSLSTDALLKAFQRGWTHEYRGEAQRGFYVGREHPGHTEVRVVRSLNANDKENYMRECEEGRPGWVVTRGGNIMSGYANAASQPFAQSPEEQEGGLKWYTKFD